MPNAYDPVHAVGSGMAYLAGGLAQTKIIEHLFPTRSPSVAAHARTAFTKLFGVEFFSGFEKLLPDLKHSGGNRMGMPLLSDSLAEQGMQALRSVLAMFLVQVPEVVPTNTWLEAALKLPLLSFSGHASRIEPLMNRLVNGQQLGPVACLLLGREIANPQATRQLAIMGLLCADSEGFLKDARAFMDRKVAAGQMTASLARSLANLNDDELQALAFLAGEKQGKCLAQAAAAVRQAGGPELDVVLEPLLVQWWNTSLKEPVKTELRKLTRARD